MTAGDFHPGHTVPFWYQACDDQRRGGCHGLGVMQSVSCRKGSGWACNELGVLSASGRIVAAPPAELFRRACALNFKPGCDNTKAATSGAEGFKRADPGPDDYPYLFQEGKGPLPFMSNELLYERACNQYWFAACGDLGALYFRGNLSVAAGQRQLHQIGCGHRSLIYCRKHHERCGEKRTRPEGTGAGSGLTPKAVRLTASS